MPRLGDDIDDHCSRCKRTTDHSILAMMDEDVLRVRCRTCNNEHKYRGKKGVKEMTKEEAFNKVLASVSAQLAGAEPPNPRSKKKKSS